MKKGYLVLKNGCVLTGTTNADANALGKAEFQGTTAVLDGCQFQLDYAPSHLPAEMVGKIVIDELPLEYHMYDVKSTFVA